MPTLQESAENKGPWVVAECVPLFMKSDDILVLFYLIIKKSVKSTYNQIMTSDRS